MATLYIPYVVGSSAIAYLGKEIVSYMYREDNLEKIEESENTNAFLKKESEETTVFDIIEDDCIDREYNLDSEKEKETIEKSESEIPFPELPKYKSAPESTKKVSFKIEKEPFNPRLNTIKEEETDSIELSSKPLLTSKLHKCKKCNIFLPLKCFSKTQKKKLPTNWTCKVCLKLN